MLVNDVIHELFPEAVAIGEDVRNSIPSCNYIPDPSFSCFKILFITCLVSHVLA